MPLAPVAPRIKKRMVTVVDGEKKELGGKVLFFFLEFPSHFVGQCRTSLLLITVMRMIR